MRETWILLDGDWDFALEPEIRWRSPAQVVWDRRIRVPFSPDPLGPLGLHLTREGGHAVRRIAHAADATGKAIHDALLARAARHPNISLRERWMAVDLITSRHLKREEAPRCYGVYALDIDGRRVETLAASGVVLAVLVFFGAAAMQSSVFRERITSSLETGDMALREQSYPISLSLIRERPIAGWGPALNAAEIGRRLAHPAYPKMDTHNLILYVLTSAGFLGGGPFLLALAICAWTAWSARNGCLRPISIATLTPTSTRPVR